MKSMKGKHQNLKKIPTTKSTKGPKGEISRKKSDYYGNYI